MQRIDKAFQRSELRKEQTKIHKTSHGELYIINQPSMTIYE